MGRAIKTDILIIGGGILGAATAYELISQFPDKRILLIEKEPQPAMHQTGRNSGVIHAGVYYPPESLKAKYCKEGLQSTIQFCQDYSVPYLQCGKLLVATDSNELERMEALFDRCEKNDLSPILLSSEGLKKREPNVVGKGAIYIQRTGITDYRKITSTMLELFKSKGGSVAYNQQLVSLIETEQGLTAQTKTDVIHSRFMINCAGLHSDRIARMLNLDIDYQIVPFKGEYYRLPNRYNDLVSHLIYPIPNPNMPFLGVHLTKMIDGSVTVGPNAVLALAREGYEKWQFSLKDNLELLRFKGIWPLLKHNYRSGLGELQNSMLKKSYLGLVQKYCPQITLSDLQPYPSGIRAQAVSTSGELLHDFKFFETACSLHVGNAPSPAATSAIPIAKNIVEKLLIKIS